jgi:hypothetical protein
MMDMQAAPPVYAEMNTGQPPVGNPPVLGQQVPGMSGGLPTQGGLTVTANPMANQLQSQGRGEDSMLVHMTPDEVNSLQGLAMAHGGSLTINPETGLPEAGFLKKLLPTILGAALAATGVGAPLAAGIVGAGQFARTGSLKKGLMAGLGAFGGAGMAGMAGLGGSISHNALGVLGKNPGFFGANMGLGATVPASQLAPVTVTADTAANATASQIAGPMNVPASGIPGGPGATSITMGGPTAAANPIQTAINSPEFAKQFASSVGNMPAPVMEGAQFTGGLGSRFAQATRAGLPAGTPGFISKAVPMAAGLGALSNVSSAMTPSAEGAMGDDGVIDNSYAGPYTAQQRKATFADSTDDILNSSKERRYFDVDMPEVYNMQGQVVQPGSSTARGTPILQNVLNPKAKKGQNRYNQILTPYMMGYADGGEVELSDGAFVLDARTVSELGNGSSNAGLEALRRIGGRPVEGPGDGVSDSVPARIGRDQPARVARDEAIIPADAVKRIGGGSAKRGADKLYSLMDKAHKARKTAKRGQDTKVSRGLA